MAASQEVAEGEGGAVRFEPYLGAIAQNVFRNPIRKVMVKMEETPGCMSLAGGRPCKDVFPEAVKAWGEDDEAFTNYGGFLATGAPELKAWAKEHVQKFHSPPGMQDRDVFMTSGNTDGMTKTVMLLTDPGDVVLADEVTYPGICASAGPLGRRVHGVQVDKNGMVPEHLEAALKGLESGAKARLLYLTPHGQNPTGATLSESRKDEVYAIARKYGLTILEDDPYYFLRLERRDPSKALEEDNMWGAEGGPRSMLARDTDGRVVRLDTCSKMLAPGLRLGWVTASKAIMAKWQVLAEVFTWSVSGVQQKSFLNTMRDLGDQGLHRHLQRVQLTYAQRRAFLLAACERHLAGLCKWWVPDYGMFFWLELTGCSNTDELVDELISSYKVAMVPGSFFKTPEGASSSSSSFFRVSFSQLSEEKADKAMQQLRAFMLARGAAAAAASGEASAAVKRPLSQKAAEEEPPSKLLKAVAA